jgi:putative peptidoglycan lipid II flippase
MLLYRAYIVRLIYGAGNFGWNDTILTFNTLGVFTVSLFAQALIPLFARAFYARHNTVTPVITGLFAMLFNVALSYYFALHPAAADLSLGNLKISFDTSGSVGLALGFTIANIVHGLILFTLLRGRMAKAFSGNFQEITGFDSALIGNLSKIICRFSL